MAERLGAAAVAGEAPAAVAWEASAAVDLVVAGDLAVAAGTAGSTKQPFLFLFQKFVYFCTDISRLCKH
jgi:hypothetical protein